ncbi:hypothetical protein CRG98_035449 [Punica granatum]|uniref:Uncharacterized protein n=1 Tax=Punica granatum TaxID=22663 RepID=A0A2I0ILA9_PUNGR|nr:hypothetical protein CRG98_035449 [Punica granatum]
MGRTSGRDLRDKEMGRGPLARSGPDRGERQRRGCGRRFSPLDAATTAREGSGDGSGHRLDCAVSDLDFAGVETAGIDGKEIEVIDLL